MQALYAVERMAMSVLSVTTPESKIGLSSKTKSRPISAHSSATDDAREKRSSQMSRTCHVFLFGRGGNEVPGSGPMVPS